MKNFWLCLFELQFNDLLLHILPSSFTICLRYEYEIVSLIISLGLLYPVIVLFLIPRWLRSLNIGTGQKGADGFPVLCPYNDSEVNRRKTSQNSLKKVMQHKNPHITLEITAFALAAWVLLFSGQWREAGKISTTQMAPFVSESHEMSLSPSTSYSLCFRDNFTP